MPAVNFSQMSDEKLTPAPAWRFWVTFPDIPGSSTSSETLGFLLSRVTAAGKAVEIEPVPFNAGTRHFPTGWSTDVLTLTFYENIGFDVAQAFRSWIDKVVDDEGNFELPKNYKKEMKLEALGYDGKTLVTYTWKDCMPQRLDGYDWDGSTTNHISPTLTMHVDSAVKPQAGSV